MKMLKKVLIVLCMLFLPFYVQAEDNSKIYTTTDENAVIEKIMITDNSITLFSVRGALYEKFNELLPYLQIEEEAALINADPALIKEEESSIVSTVTQLEEQGLNSSQIYSELSKVYDGVQYVINNDGSIVFLMNGVEISEKDDVLRVRYLKADVLEAQVEENKLVYNNIEYTIEQE